MMKNIFTTSSKLRISIWARGASAICVKIMWMTKSNSKIKSVGMGKTKSAHVSNHGTSQSRSRCSTWSSVAFTRRKSTEILVRVRCAVAPRGELTFRSHKHQHHRYVVCLFQANSWDSQQTASKHHPPFSVRFSMQKHNYRAIAQLNESQWEFAFVFELLLSHLPAGNLEMLSPRHTSALPLRFPSANWHAKLWDEIPSTVERCLSCLTAPFLDRRMFARIRNWSAKMANSISRLTNFVQHWKMHTRRTSALRHMHIVSLSWVAASSSDAIDHRTWDATNVNDTVDTHSMLMHAEKKIKFAF